MSEDIIICENLVKIYKTKDLEVLALQGLDLNIAKGELMAIIGNSGSGKSTFLNMIGGLDRPSAGKLTVDGLGIDKVRTLAVADAPLEIAIREPDTRFCKRTQLTGGARLTVNGEEL